MSTEEAIPKTAERSQNIAKQGGVVASMTMLSRITGLVRDVVLSYVFGASQFADMFFVAFRIPNFFRRLFAEGAFSQAFVPVMVRYKERGELAAFIAPLSGLFALALAIAVVLGVWGAPWLTALFAPGWFIDQPALSAQTAELVQITFPYLGFVSLTAYAGSLLNAHNKFAVPAFTPVLLNMTLIGAALFALTKAAATDFSLTLAWGVLAAGVIQLIFQLPSMWRLGLIVRPNLDRQHPGVRQVGKLLVPAVLAASVGQINALVNTMLASTLITGSISWLYYADRLLELPVGLVAVALGTVMLPHLSRMAAGGDAEQFRQTLDWGISLGLLLGLPAAVALYLLAQPLLAAIFMSFGSGAMTAHDVRMAGHALQMFAVALPGFVLVKILAPAFFAHEDTRSPLKCAAGAVLVNLIASLLTFRWFGHVGLAWATALSAWVNVVLLYVALKRRDLYIAGAGLLPMLGKVMVATLLLGLALVAATPTAGEWLAMPGLYRLAGVLLVCGLGVGGYLLVLWLLGVRLKHVLHRS